jgi:ATP-dependent Zn protease
MGTELRSKRLPTDDYAMSDHTRRLVDEEQQFIADQAHRRALTLVDENRTLLEAFAFTLLDNEVLERVDIERIVARYRDRLNGGPPETPEPTAGSYSARPAS